MEMAKKFLFSLVFGALVVVGLSAQAKRGYIKPTYALGFATSDYLTGMAMSIDIDFVNNFGLTLGLKGLFAWDSHFAANPVPFGIGYTYDGGKWTVGGKLMAVPFEVANVGGVGFDINGTYWLRENLGITGIMDLYFPKDIGTVFSLRIGVSLKY
jgi:hypothetical protein